MIAILNPSLLADPLSPLSSLYRNVNLREANKMSSNGSATRKQAAIDFARLPMDIHTLILLRLPPSDIMSFRKACYSASWANVYLIE